VQVFVQLAVSLEVIKHLCWEVRNEFKEYPLFEVRDNEVKGGELEELVRVFVERVKYQVLELKKKNNKNWPPESFCELEQVSKSYHGLAQSFWREVVPKSIELSESAVVVHGLSK
jgi:hypothetical protein